MESAASPRPLKTAAVEWGNDEETILQGSFSVLIYSPQTSLIFQKEYPTNVKYDLICPYFSKNQLLHEGSAF